MYLGEDTEALWSVEVTVPMKPLAKMEGANMTLGNDLSMGFFVKQDAVPEGAYAVVCCGDDIKEIAMVDWIADDASGLYRIVYSGIAAKAMTDEITVQIFNSEHKAVSEIWTDSVQDYAVRMLTNESSTAALKTALVDMLNYGTEAQRFFAYKTDDLANAVLTEEQQALASAEVTMTDSRRLTDGYEGSTLKLESNVVLNFYFNRNFIGKTATVTYTDHYGVAHSYEIEAAASGGLAVVSVDQLVIADASVLVTVTIDGMTAQDSVESYCARMQESLPLAEPLMKFAKSAYAQLHQENG